MYYCDFNMNIDFHIYGDKFLKGFKRNLKILQYGNMHSLFAAHLISL